MVTINNISEQELDQKLVTSLNNIVKNEGFVEHKKYIRAITTDGGNFIAELLEVDIKGKSTNGDKEINLFIKLVNLESSLNFLDVKELQEREILMYGELFRMYTQIMNDANIPEEEKFRLPRCYDTSIEFIILENVSVKGFETLERTTSFPFSFAALAIKQLAKFHALSLALQNKRPEYFDTKLKHLNEAFKVSSQFLAIVNKAFDLACGMVDEHSGKRLKAAYDKIFDFEKLFKGPKWCMCHGDYRISNLMFKKEDGEIIDVLPVDFQYINYSNPMIEFWFLMIPHTDQEFRRKHLSTFKELYFDTLTQFLKYFEIDVSSVYSRKEFDKDYEDKMPYGLITAITSLLFLFAEEGSVLDLNDSSSIESITLKGSAKNRIQDAVNDYINWGII